MEVKIIKGIESAGRFPYGHMSKENAQFLNDNVGNIFQATRININGYVLDAKLPSGKNANVHIYNVFEMQK